MLLTILKEGGYIVFRRGTVNMGNHNETRKPSYKLLATFDKEKRRTVYG